MNIVAPVDDGSGYPTLGPQVVDWMHENLVFGPGDLLGQKLELDAEQQWFIWRFYELYPKGHEQEGRRRFQRCCLSLAKGLRKTELASCVAAAELHPDAPVRFAGWRGRRGTELKQGRGITDPFVVLMATTEQQSNELAFAALTEIISNGPLAKDFDVGLERIARLKGRGKAVSVAGSPSAQDGARTTFQLFDETHHLRLPRQVQAHQTMLANMPKRPLADPWALETTTAPEPGAGSVAEATMDYGRAVASGKVKDAALFYFHRQASDKHDLATVDGRKDAVIEASGPAAAWRDVTRIVAKWDEPDADVTFLERVWLNRLVQQSRQAFDVEHFKTLAKPGYTPKRGAMITVGFDGALFHDSTALVATEVETGYQWLAGLWECPHGRTDWQVPEEEVNAAVRYLFGMYHVWKMYADPAYWQGWIAVWAGEYGSDRIIEWHTNSRKKMSMALINFTTAIKTSALSHDGDPRYVRHIANARRQDLNWVDEQGHPLWLICKERPDSPHKMDAAMAGVLSHEARTDAVAEGVLTMSVYMTRGVRRLGE